MTRVTTAMRPSARAAGLRPSSIIAIAERARARGAVDLAMGTPDEGPSEPLRSAALRALAGDQHQYADPAGLIELRGALASTWAARYGGALDPEAHVTITCGATEAMCATLFALIEPGDPVALFEPFYEGHRAALLLAGASPRPVALKPPRWEFDEHELERVIASGVRALVMCTPSNPCGKVFDRREIATIRRLCGRHGVLCISDETYEGIVYDGAEPTSLLQGGLDEHSVVIGSFGKALSATGWRIGFAFAHPALTASIRTVHEVLTVVAPVPLQHAVATALRSAEQQRGRALVAAARRRALLVAALRAVGFECESPQGGLYVMAGLPRGMRANASAVIERLIDRARVSAASGEAFFVDPRRGRRWLRFSFVQRHATVRHAAQRLRLLGAGALPSLMARQEPASGMSSGAQHVQR